MIKKWVGITTSIGIGPTKTLAKVAGDFAKKDPAGVFDLSNLSLQDSLLSHFPIKDIWGIGRGCRAKLNTIGIHTADDLRQATPASIRQKLGVVGERIVWELRGMSCLPLEEAKPRKNIACSRSFGHTVTRVEDLAEALATYTATACAKLRRQKSYAQGLYVYLESVADGGMGFRNCDSKAVAFSIPTNDTRVVIEAAKDCLKKLFYSQQKYKKCGIVLLDLVSQAQVVPDLFSPSNPKRELLMQTIDSLNAQMGKDTLFFGAMGTKPTWKARFDQRSSLYTSSWDGLAIARA